MSVYTPLSFEEIRLFFSRFDLGALQHYQGADGGIENTNYFISSSNKQHYVLTIFESLSEQKLPGFIDLMQHLVNANLPVPMPIADTKHTIIHHIKNKPAMLFPRLAGRHIKSPTHHHCEQIATTIAQLHVATANYPTDSFEDYTLPWAQTQVPQLLKHTQENDRCLLNEMSQACARFLETFKELPQGLIHGDLFHDNALFDRLPGHQSDNLPEKADHGESTDEDTLTGLIDFYHSGPGFLIYDLAVAVNDWCVDESFSLNTDKMNGMLNAYEKIRPLTPLEKQAWPQMLVFAAYRFWVSRLRSQMKSTNIRPAPSQPSSTKEGLILTVKDPNEFKLLMQTHRKQLKNTT